MALEYFLYTTAYTNTLVERSNNSFSPLPPYGEIHIDYFIPNYQPLYYYRESGGTIVVNSEANINAYLQGTAQSPQPEDNVLQHQFTGYTATTDNRIDNLINSLSGVTTGTTIDAISFHADATANVTLTNQTLAEQFLANNNRNIRLIDLTNALQLRLSTRVVTTSASVNNPRLILKYSTVFSTVVGGFSNAGVSEISAALSPVGISSSGWIDIAPSAKGNVYLTTTQIGGDGVADPAVGNIIVEIKNIVKTADTILTGVTKQEFDNYTGTTAPATYVNKTDFNSYSGTTVPNTYYNKTQINTYTGNTATAIGLKLNTSTFSTYTGTTVPNTYYNKSEINGYTGQTLTNINSRLLTSVYQNYTGTTVPNTYYNKTQINNYTGSTLTNINSRLLTTVFNSFTGTTLPANYYNKTQINSYTGATSTAIGLKANITSPTFLVSAIAPTPAANNNSTCIATTAWYFGQCGTANPLMNGVVAVGTSALWSKQDHVHPVDTSRLAVTAFNTYSGTTVPNTYYNKTQINSYTGATRTELNLTITGSTNLGAGNVIAAKSGRNITHKSLIAGTGVVITNTASDITICSTGGGSVWGGITGTISSQTDLNNCLNARLLISNFNTYSGNTATAIGLKAPITSPTFLVSACAPNPAANDNSTCIATTAWYFGQCATGLPVMDGVATVGVSPTWAHGDHVHPSNTAKANLAGGAAFTGVITVPKPAANDNTTCVATTSWYISQAGAASPLMNGTVAIGTSLLFARQDHVHPVDTSRQATITGGATTITTSNLTASRVLVSDASGKVAVSTVTSTELVTSVAKVFGNNYQYVQDLTSTSTNSTSPQTKLTMTTPSLPAGTYRVNVSWISNRNTASNSARYDVTLNGTPQGTESIMRIEFKDTTNQIPLSRNLILSLSGVNTLEFRYWGETTGNQTTVSDATMELFRVQ